jgi:prolyl 4-hydroxylase
MNRKKTPPGEISAGRTSWNCRVSATHPAVRGAIQRAAYLSKVFPSHAEPAQVVRYLPGQKYNKHHDYFDRAAPSFYAKTKNGGPTLDHGLGVPPRTRSRRPHVVPYV